MLPEATRFGASTGGFVDLMLMSPNSLAQVIAKGDSEECDLLSVTLCGTSAKDVRDCFV